MAYILFGNALFPGYHFDCSQRTYSGQGDSASPTTLNYGDWVRSGRRLASPGLHAGREVSDWSRLVATGRAAYSAASAHSSSASCRGVICIFSELTTRPSTWGRRSVQLDTGEGVMSSRRPPGNMGRRGGACHWCAAGAQLGLRAATWRWADL